MKIKIFKGRLTSSSDGTYLEDQVNAWTKNHPACEVKSIGHSIAMEKEPGDLAKNSGHLVMTIVVAYEVESAKP